MGIPFTYKGMTLIDGSFSVRAIHIGLDTYRKRSDERKNDDKLWDINVMKQNKIIFGRTHCVGVRQLRVVTSYKFRLIKPKSKFVCKYAK